jgi:hypothetical protein
MKQNLSLKGKQTFMNTLTQDVQISMRILFFYVCNATFPFMGKWNATFRIKIENSHSQ